MELTATGIVTDFHRIPYYPWSVATDKDPIALQIYEKNGFARFVLLKKNEHEKIFQKNGVRVRSECDV